MFPIISIVGASDSGKTTLIEKLIPALNEAGIAVGTIKHDVHGFDIDKPGKDSWRHGQAGSRLVAVSSPSQVAAYEQVDSELSLDEVVSRYFYDVDLIITEGFKREAKQKIEVYRGAVSSKLLSDEEELLFVAADTPPPLSEAGAARVVDLNDIKTMVSIIVKEVVERTRPPAVSLYADGEYIPLNKIMKPMVINTFLGLIASLKGVNDPSDVRLRIRKTKREV